MDEKTDDTKPAKKAAARPVKDDWSKGKVNAAEVTRGTLDSDSVRRVQHVLSHLKGLPKELRPEVTGDYDARTTRALRWWQNNHGYVGGRGINPSAEQVAKLLGDDYTVVDE